MYGLELMALWPITTSAFSQAGGRVVRERNSYAFGFFAGRPGVVRPS